MSKTTEATNTGFKWTKEVMKNADKNLIFMKVGGPKVAPRVLAGTVRAWKTNKDTDRDLMFVLPYRLTGTESDIRKTLKNSGIDNSEINTAITGAITYQNYKSPKNAILISEESKNRTNKRDFNATDKDLWNKIGFLSKHKKDKNFKLVPKKTEQAKRKVDVGQQRNRKKLDVAIEQVANGKVIDVSGLDTKTGVGYVSIPIPKTNSKSGKFGSSELKLYSNNINTFNAALDLIFGSDAHKTTHKSISDDFLKQKADATAEVVQKANGKKKVAEKEKEIAKKTTTGDKTCKKPKEVALKREGKAKTTKTASESEASEISEKKAKRVTKKVKTSSEEKPKSKNAPAPAKKRVVKKKEVGEIKTIG